MAEKKEFQAESKRLLDLMINSIYTHKEIFLRELISNASDAIDKYYHWALEHHEEPGDLSIRIELDEPNRTLTISDNGIGMTKAELEENLGTIAKSGTLAFREELKKKDQSQDDVIGQFGVGFYSAFMVADKVSVFTKSAESDEAWEWTSEGADGYEIEPCDKKERGTDLVLHLKADDDTEDYSQYLSSYRIEDLVKKYSDYIRYPIRMTVETTKEVDGETKTESEDKTLNSMVPLWKRPKSEVTEEDLASFYRQHFFDYMDPQRTIFFNVEGTVDFTALLYIPSRVPEGFYSQDYKPGLQLYSRGVFIMDHCEELLPPYLRFVRGLVDSQDLSLNISREMLQQDHQLRLIRNRIERKVLNELGSMLAKDREAYETFWKNFGLDIKFGIYSSFGADRDKLEDLLLFYSTDGGKLVTLQEFVSSMPEDQKDIYYVSARSTEAAAKLPVVKSLEKKGYRALILTAEVDEFVMQTLAQYKDHPFTNASSADLDLQSEEEKEQLEKTAGENKGLLDFMKEALPEVASVRLSARLVDDPVTLVAGNGLSFEMEKVYAAMASQADSGMPPLKAERILEVNPDSKIFSLLKEIWQSDPQKARDITEVLYDQALLIEGFPLKDPIDYARKVTELIA